MKKLFILFLFYLLFNTSAWADLEPTRFVTFNDAQIAVYEGSGTKGPGLLLIHGNTSTANYYSRFMDTEFASNYKVAALDLPGHGNSDWLANYDIDTFANAISTVATELGLEDGILVGWSLGGDIAFQAVGLLPHLRGIFTFGTAPIGYTPNLPSPFLAPEESYAGAAVYYGVIDALTTEQVNDYVTAFFRPDYSPIPQALYRSSQKTDPATRAAVLAAVLGNDPSFQDEVIVAKNLQIPLMMVLGENEAFVRPAYMDALAPELPTLVGGKIVYVPQAGHAIMYETPNVFANLLEDFINEIE